MFMTVIVVAASAMNLSRYAVLTPRFHSKAMPRPPCADTDGFPADAPIMCCSSIVPAVVVNTAVCVIVVPDVVVEPRFIFSAVMVVPLVALAPSSSVQTPDFDASTDIVRW